MPPDNPATATESAAVPDRIEPGKWLVLGAVCLAAVMMPLSFTGPSVALPAIGADLGGSPAALAWVLNAFILAVGSTVMAAGALADLHGRKRMFRIGLILFALTSLGTALAPSLPVLALVRAAQGVAGALAMVGGIAAMAQEFEGAARTRAYSVLGTSFGIGLAFGPIVAGVLVEAFGWRSVFALSVLLALLVLAVGVPRLTESRDPDAKSFDGFGMAGFTAMLLLLTLAIMQGPQSGWSSGIVIALFAGAAAMLVAFLMIERAQARPMLDVSLFTYPRFLAVQSLPVATAYSFVVLLVLIPTRFIGVEGLDASQTGLMLMPLCAPMAVIPFVGALFTRWVSAGVLSGLGLILGAAGLVLLSRVAPGAPLAAFVLPLVMIGVGAAIPWGLMDDLAVSVVPKERAGMATGIFGTMRVAGEAIAIAVTSAVLLALSQSGLREKAGGLGEDAILAAANRVVGGSLAEAASAAGRDASVLRQVYGEAFSTTMLVLAAITLLAAVVAIAFVRRHEVGAGEAEATDEPAGDPAPAPVEAGQRLVASAAD